MTTLHPCAHLGALHIRHCKVYMVALLCIEASSGNTKDGFHLSRGVLYLVLHLTMGICTIVHNSVCLM